MTEIVSKPDRGERITGERGEGSLRLNVYFDDIEEKLNNFLLSSQGIQLRSYTVATLPPVPPVTEPRLIFVSNEVGGSIPAFSDGSNWRRVTDRTIVA